MKSRLYNKNHVEVSGGIIQGVVESYSNKIAVISAGELLSGVAAYNDSYAYISGGQIQKVIAHDNSFVDIAGGVFTNSIIATNNAIVDITGGLFGDTVDAKYNAIITIYGNSFNYPYGEMTAGSGILTGILDNGDTINTNFNINHYGPGYDGAMIVLVPEPATLLLLGLGAVVLRKRSYAHP